MQTFDELKVRHSADLHSGNNVHVFVTLTQPLLLKMTIGKHQNPVLAEYIRCPKFRARMKPIYFGCFHKDFSTEEVMIFFGNKYKSILPVPVCFLLHMQKQQLFSVVYDFIMRIVKDPNHQHLSFLNDEDHCFGFAVDILVPEVQFCVTCNHGCSLSKDSLQE